MDQLAGDSQTNLSIEEERKIARTFMGRIEWEMIVIGLGQVIVWVTTWGLVVNNLIPLWAGFIIATVSTACAYLPSHAGQHGHLSGKHKHLKWLNTVVSQISLIPLAQSHHKSTSYIPLFLREPSRFGFYINSLSFRAYFGPIR